MAVFCGLAAQFIVPHFPIVDQYLLPTLVLVPIDIAVLFGYAVFGSALSAALSGPGAVWFERVSGAVLLGLALALALSL